MKRLKDGRGTDAERMLDILEKAHPAGVPTAQIAQEIFGTDSLENRIKVQRLAKSLRHLGHRVYAEGGMYYLGNIEVLKMANRRFTRMACGFLRGGADTARGVGELGDPVSAEQLRAELKQAVRNLLEAI
ncbi:MAG: hypothetical protein ACPLPR_01405 [Bacillota bacterium]